jgi:hypothetical protein
MTLQRAPREEDMNNRAINLYVCSAPQTKSDLDGATDADQGSMERPKQKQRSLLKQTS